jgi:hypothetical protein
MQTTKLLILHVSFPKKQSRHSLIAGLPVIFRWIIRRRSC